MPQSQIPHNFMKHNKPLDIIKISEQLERLQNVLRNLKFGCDELSHGIAANPTELRLHVLSEQLATLTGVCEREVEYWQSKHIRFTRIHNLAGQIFTDESAISDWLSKPAPALNVAIPIDLLGTDAGSEQVEALLRGIAYGHVL